MTEKFRPRLVWCPRCPEIVEEQTDGRYVCVGCKSVWAADGTYVPPTPEESSDD